MRLTRMLKTLLCSGFMLGTACHADGLPQCFKMTNDALNRFYVVAPDTTIADPLAYATPYSASVRVYEYLMGPAKANDPTRRSLILQSSLAGHANMSEGNLSWVMAYGKTGTETSIEDVSTLRIDSTSNPGGAGWNAQRSTHFRSFTDHALVSAPCELPTL